ncbi:WASH complex subunit 3 isoform X2 [Coregonus clupeaformis]|uniref:WASH complex subunit 3 isoform X2 n=1 Tax=Coregonus clupeaformis TaxID=59861 RepID=UPI001E1C4EEB|nr:WASH complex subunit 3 isoform X2 [Coregonus clupeaformis]
MDEDGLPIVGSGIDLTKVPAIQQRRVVAYLNQFIVHTVRFLNRFSTVCEEKLASISLRIQQIETTLSILEAKLSSIPGLEDVRVEGVGQRPATEANGPVAVVVPSQPETPIAVAVPLPPSEASPSIPEPRPAEAAGECWMTVAKDPRYARYLKMVQVGVPVMAIKNKMVQEGLDPNLLDTPDAPVPDAGKKNTVDQDDDSDDGSESSFSD